MPGETVVLPRPDQLDDLGTSSEEWIVIVYDNDTNTYEQVINILIEATGCSLEEAELETWEVDHLGKSVVHHADKLECERAAAIIRRIGIEVAVDKL